MRITRCPPVTSDSLFASATSFLASMNLIVGTRPAMPTAALTTRSTFAPVHMFIAFAAPETMMVPVPLVLSLRSSSLLLSITAAACGANFLICSASSSTLELHTRASTLALPSSATTSRVWVPMEPVEPYTAILFISSLSCVR